jgi:ABC-type sugar transport system permease subunit
MAYLILLPAMVPMLIFVFIPVLAAIGLSFTNFDPLVLRMQWIGIANYAEAFQSDLFRITVRNTLQYTVGYVPTSMFVGFLAAILLNRRFRGISFLRGAYYLPVLTSTIAIGIAWMWLFQPQAGLVSQALKQFGVPPRDWIRSPQTAMPAVISVAVWQSFGGTMLIYLAGLQGIPEAFYEAAKIDGAGRWQSLRHITLPLLRPVTFYLFITGVIGSLQVFGLIMIMTEGGPAFRTTSIVHQIFLNAFRFNRMGYASGMAVILFVAIAILTYFNWKFFSSALEY